MTIHRVLNSSIPELNRVLELIQKQTTNQILTPTNISSSPSGGAGIAVSSATPGPAGPAVPQGRPGADGVANLDLLVVAQNEEEIVVVDNNGDVVYDELGLAVMETHIGWALVTDDQGNIITAE